MGPALLELQCAGQDECQFLWRLWREAQGR